MGEDMRATMDYELLERIERDEREWATARLHHAQHGNWLSPDECATCLQEADEMATEEGRS
jgi:hypothetical protein